jgi:tyrosyl-tRNA synthetase
MGGSDQWGNITAGCDLIRKMIGGKAHGLVLPLVTTAAGAKFGKTEAGTVWLAPERTSPFRFYQFWLHTDDRDVVKYLKFFTWLDRAAIEDLERRVAAAPERREAQRRLAAEVTAMVHGPDHLQKAERASAVLFGGSLSGLSADELLVVFDDAPATTMTRTALVHSTVAATVWQAGLAASKGEAARLIKQGGVYVNGVRTTDDRRMMQESDAIDGRVVVLQKGARERRLVRVEPD